jgi:hypothetical protein
MSYTIKEIRKNVLMVEADTQYEIASMFLRIQEFYESPFDNIYRKVFTLEEYMDTYARENGAFTYYMDWAGFNVPGNIVQDFYQKFHYMLSAKEQLLWDLIRNTLETDNSQNFYLIGVCKTIQRALNHELAHAYWYLEPNYRNSGNNILSDMHAHTSLYSKALDTLKRKGYRVDMIDDEIQAYLATTNDRQNLLEMFGWQNEKNIKIPTAFKRNFNRTDKHAKI